MKKEYEAEYLEWDTYKKRKIFREVEIEDFLEIIEKYGFYEFSAPFFNDGERRLCIDTNYERERFKNPSSVISVPIDKEKWFTDYMFLEKCEPENCEGFVKNELRRMLKND